MFVFLILFQSYLSAEVTFKWLGISSFLLSDSKTTLLFDPAITRASLWHYLPLVKIQTDENEVDYWLNRCNTKTVDAIFVNHAHFDHAADVSYIAKKFNSEVYGSSSTKNIALGQGVENKKITIIQSKKLIQIGDFTITPITTPHPPHFKNIMLMDGDISTPLPVRTSVWDYLVGETFSFHITHPKVNILFQANSRILSNDPLEGIKAKNLLLTIANRPSTEDLIQRRIIPTEAKLIIPLHHDNFFYSMKRTAEIDLLWMIEIEEFLKKTKKFNIKLPKYCDEIQMETNE